MTPRIDAHQHFWRLARGDYRWIKPELAPLYRDFEPADLAPHLQICGFDHTVLVQATDSIAETEHLLALGDRHAFIAGVVGWVDLEASDAREQLTRLARNDKLVGIRPMLQDLDDDAWILRANLAPALRALVELELRLDALVRPHQLRSVCELAARHADLPIVIDHGGKPCIADGGRAWNGFDAWRNEITRLASFDNVAVKLSGLVTEAGQAWTVDRLRPFVDVLLTSFGPSRCLWGSDWPVVDLAGGYEHWWDATDKLLRALDSRERDLVLGGSALRFYGIPLAAAGSVPTGAATRTAP